MNQNLIWNPNITLLVRSSVPSRWITLFLNTLLAPEKTKAIDLRYFVAEKVKINIPLIPGPSKPNQVAENVYMDFKPLRTSKERLIYWRNFEENYLKRKPIHLIYRKYPHTRAGLLEFFQNWKDFQEVPALSMKQEMRYEVEVHSYQQCLGLKQDYKAMDEATIYLCYRMVCGLDGASKGVEVCDKLVLKNCQIVEYHHQPKLNPIVWKGPKSDEGEEKPFNLIDKFQDELANQNIEGILNLCAEDVKFRSYFTPTDTENMNDPCEVKGRKDFELWLKAYFDVFAPRSYYSSHKVEGEKCIFITTKGTWSLPWPRPYYGIQSFAIRGRSSNENSKITNIVWHCDTHAVSG